MSDELKELNQIAVGRRIRTMREARGMSRETLAEIVDISPQFIADIEYGNKGMSIRTLFFLKQALGVTSDYILAGNLYSVDEDTEAARACEDIIVILHTCNTSQLKDFREISRIYADNVKRNKEHIYE